MKDIESRLSHRVPLTTDGHKAYLKAVDTAFDHQVDYAQLAKVYGEPLGKGSDRSYSSANFVRADKVAVTGLPRFEKVSTSHVERQNLTLRMHMLRFTRLTNGFSKKIENLHNAVALHLMYYNFAQIHKTQRVTPAMEAGICDHIWSIEEIARLILEPVVTKRGSYKNAVISN